jgi:hypothetical protein
MQQRQRLRCRHVVRCGVDVKANSCKSKLGKGQVCGVVGELSVGHRCKSGSCKIAGISGDLKCK